MAAPDEIDYGPLAGLIGTWEGDKGLDVAPTAADSEDNQYSETIVFEAGGDLENAKAQKLAIVPYRQVVRRRSNGEVFHHQVGYWLWDAAAKTVMQSLNLPRAIAVLAGGKFKGEVGRGDVVLKVRATLGDKDWGIVQSPFLRDNASSEAFEHRITLCDDRLSYFETTSLAIYGRSIAHTDQNELERKGDSR